MLINKVLIEGYIQLRALPVQKVQHQIPEPQGPQERLEIKDHREPQDSQGPQEQEVIQELRESQGPQEVKDWHLVVIVGVIIFIGTVL
jgi:hypothetical protein